MSAKRLHLHEVMCPRNTGNYIIEEMVLHAHKPLLGAHTSKSKGQFGNCVNLQFGNENLCGENVLQIAQY
jgi:hypothetical protein